MSTALIGYTGFVGGTLLRTRDYDETYNSSNIADIKGRHFSSVICAGAKAVKWQANKDPSGDLAGINTLIEAIDQIETDHFVLVSTVDVYGNPVGVSEADIPAEEGLHAYGLNRRVLEKFVATRFSSHSIIRLPGLFGTGLRKNLIFDLLTDNLVDQINPSGRLQWYPMRRFAEDIDQIVASRQPLVNIAVEPILTNEIAAQFFPEAAIGEAKEPAPNYDMQTQYADVLEGQGRYHLTKSQVLEELGLYIEGEKRGAK
ncbi:hypothetical protein [Asticcacaulis excentricus]|uniref:NAD-dependent epimerase/dehydratase n=1 Tax=Asticcacaulis excentricus (strain ATCC 15261 / DSM 4724 / KCTC 12464 / NCIMB 9791 / VKM B-1370 / CB 48) TaxID=573065 RepID=E8RMP5_ASTEC|nr:hypothetical protein [Asticcacaulis excentricus]ADU13926.1 hypothetical protein Astex_2271 [Asticcacaulis excentricus CB 48]